MLFRSDAAEKLREELGKDKTSAYKVNLANSAEIREVFGKIVADFKQIHGLINNAGIVSTVPFDEVTQAEWDKVIAINLTGVYTAISAVYPSMKANVQKEAAAFWGQVPMRPPRQA